MSFKPLRSIYNQLSTLSFPTLSTQAATSVTGTTAVGNGTLINTGGSAISARGFVYSSSVINPTLADSVEVAAGTGTGDFSDTLTGLTGGTTYYYRAYATNTIGTGYGDTVIFTTVSATYSPTFMMMGMGL